MYFTSNYFCKNISVYAYMKPPYNTILLQQCFALSRLINYDNRTYNARNISLILKHISQYK